jgi:DNA polymerase elongation subunit (family B)
MCLYSQLRKTAGFEPSYSLEYILSKYGEKGKVLNLDLAGHIHYSNRRFLDYIIYNQYDVMGLYIMEKKNNDFLQFMINSRIVPLHEFNLSTRTVTYEHFYYFSKQGKIISSAGNEPITEEHLIQRYYKKKYGIEVKKNQTVPKFGGAVLRPERCKNVGINIFDRKNPFNENNETLVHLAISDLDLSSAYPTNMMTYNISRSTSVFTVFDIENRHQLDVHLLFNNLVALRENSVYLCNEFLGLPNYLDLVD